MSGRKSFFPSTTDSNQLELPPISTLMCTDSESEEDGPSSQSLLACLTRPFPPPTFEEDSIMIIEPSDKIVSEVIVLSSDEEDTQESVQSSTDEWSEGDEVKRAVLDSDDDGGGCATDLYINARAVERAAKELKFLLRRKGYNIIKTQLPEKFKNTAIYECYYCHGPRSSRDIFCVEHFPCGQLDDPREFARFHGDPAPYIPKKKWKPTNWPVLRRKLNTMR